jgi:hypothetical protein
MKKRYGSLAEKQAAYRERKAAKKAEVKAGVGKALKALLGEATSYVVPPGLEEYPMGYDAGGVVMVGYSCSKCGRNWSGTKFYDGPCPYCHQGRIRGDLAGADLAVQGKAVGEGREKPKEATEEEWAMALERAERARGYAEKFPGVMRPSDGKFSDPVWQWEHECKARVLVVDANR